MVFFYLKFSLGCNFQTLNEPNSFFSFSLKKFQILLKITHYTIRHCASFDKDLLRNWILEGSNDNINWHLISIHSNDKNLTKKSSSHTWKIDNSIYFYSHFKIRLTGLNSDENNILSLGGLELYGVYTTL
jgi:hypothetical protein